MKIVNLKKHGYCVRGDSKICRGSLASLGDLLAMAHVPRINCYLLSQLLLIYKVYTVDFKKKTGTVRRNSVRFY